MENQILVREICPTTTQEWVKNGALLVDVREKDELVSKIPPMQKVQKSK